MTLKDHPSRKTSFKCLRVNGRDLGCMYSESEKEMLSSHAALWVTVLLSLFNHVFLHAEAPLVCLGRNHMLN